MGDGADIKDPVCGRPVDPLRARAVGIYGGTTRYFCSPECKARFADPRRQDEGEAVAPDGVERRWKEGEQSSDWFARGKVTELAPPAAVERFVDLDAGAQVTALQPPSPSLLIEVNAAKQRGRTWVWMLVGLIVGATLLALGLHR